MINNILKQLIKEVESIKDINEKISVINDIREKIHNISPLKNHPVDFVKWVKSTNVEGNEYNPNHVDKTNMTLLIHSIEEDGYTMPIVTNPEENIIKIVDGFHRRKSERTSEKISKSTYGYLPTTIIREEKRDVKNRMASTIRHNRARGVHQIESMSEIIVDMVKEGWSDMEIAKHLGMNSDEVLRLKQLSGIAEIFENLDYTNSWEFKEIK